MIQNSISHVVKKINQIQKNPVHPEHHKPLSGDIYGFRRFYIGDLILICQLKDNQIIIIDPYHHKRIYN